MCVFFFFSSRRRHTRLVSDWSSDVCSSDLVVLDNARDADHVRHLLPGAPGCLVVVTSRDQLTPLVASEGAHSLVLGPLTSEGARDLLTRRLGKRVAGTP